MPEGWVIIVLVGVGAFLSRGLFFFLAPRADHVLESAHMWLSMVPPAAFAALVLPALLVPDGELRLLSAELLAAVVAAGVAWRTRSIAATILLGLGAFMLLWQFDALE
jgi:branched-subunit amino acid transport protein